MHEQMININDNNYSVLYNIESLENPFEINFIENSQHLVRENFVSTGFEAIYRDV